MPTRRVAAAAIIAAAIFGPASFAQPKAETFAIVGARLFDGERTLPSATVILKDGLIAAAGPGVAVPAGATVIDGAGKTLMPGLIDAHIHMRETAAKDALRFGVTTQLDMGGSPARAVSARALREGLGTVDGADLYLAGYIGTAPGGHGTQYGLPNPTLSKPDEAQAYVDARVADGSDFIKIVYQPDWVQFGMAPSLDRSTLAAMIKAAHARGKLAVVHTHSIAASREAIEEGADGLVHLFADAPADAAFIALARSRGVFIIPTLSVIVGGLGRPDAAALAADPRIAPHLAADQKTALQVRPVLPPIVFRVPLALQNVAALQAAGVDLMAGSDAPNPGTTHGATLHQELKLFVDAGLTPEQALRAATSIPAKRFRLADRGRIAPGLRADVVLVEGDPTTSIEATRAIVTIWKNGHPVRRGN